jgi:hypothetical protein
MVCALINTDENTGWLGCMMKSISKRTNAPVLKNNGGRAFDAVATNDSW